jgi:PAS domain S-box-containing protein
MNNNKNHYYHYNGIALRTAFIYIILSALWIVFSDRLLLNNPSTVLFISTIKGWAYTLVMGVLIYLALTRELNKIIKANKRGGESEKQFTAAFNLSPSLMSITRVSDGMILDINEEYSKLLGYSREESIGKRTSELGIWKNIDDRKTFINNLEKFGQVIDFEAKFRRKNGNIITVIDSAKNIDFQGEKCVLSVVHDITKIKAEEEKLRELDKLKDNFLSVATHELKTPLIPIKSQTQLLLSGDYGPLNQQQIRAIEMIARNEESLNRLTNDVMDISKIKSNKLTLILEEAAMDELLSDVVKDASALASEKNITIFLEPIIDVPLLVIDKPKITQVLNNLIGNAIKFTPENGKVFVNLKNNKKEALITVKDNGIGISKDNLQKIFTPFFQIQNDLNRKYRGTGLGLAIANGIIEAHGGKIWAESGGEGLGSSFIFSLPIK